jgi:hypothetical protein
MTTPTPSALPPAGRWVEARLSAPRFEVYLAAASGDRARALALYEWNAQLSAALLHDLAHLEVGLRNAYDVALSLAGLDPLTGPWPEAPFSPRCSAREDDVASTSTTSFGTTWATRSPTPADRPPRRARSSPS